MAPGWFEQFRKPSDKVKKGLERRFNEEFARRFPGMSIDHLRQGWVPVPGTLLETELQRRVMGLDGVEAVSLDCEPGRFKLGVASSKFFLRHRTYFSLTSEEFVLSRQRRIAVCRSGKGIEVHGRNLVGKLTAWLVKGVILKALQSRELAEDVAALSGEAFRLSWPLITVDLDHIEQVRRITEARFLGWGLLDLLSFGPLSVERNHVRLKVGRDMAG